MKSNMNLYLYQQAAGWFCHYLCVCLVLFHRGLWSSERTNTQMFEGWDVPTSDFRYLLEPKSESWFTHHLDKWSRGGVLWRQGNAANLTLNELSRNSIAKLMLDIVVLCGAWRAWDWFNWVKWWWSSWSFCLYGPPILTEAAIFELFKNGISRSSLTQLKSDGVGLSKMWGPKQLHWLHWFKGWPCLPFLQAAQGSILGDYPIFILTLILWGRLDWETATGTRPANDLHDWVVIWTHKVPNT